MHPMIYDIDCYTYFIFSLTGRILNRFSKDMSLVDDMLSFTFFDFVQVIFYNFSLYVKVKILCQS